MLKIIFLSAVRSLLKYKQMSTINMLGLVFGLTSFLFEDTYYANQDILWVSENFEKVFPLEMVEGIADYSRSRLGIISETAAKALFHDTDPVGKIMIVNGEMNIEITGVFRDLPSNTHLTAQYFVSYKTWIEMGVMNDRADWRGGGWWNYISR